MIPFASKPPLPQSVVLVRGALALLLLLGALYLVSLELQPVAAPTGGHVAGEAPDRARRLHAVWRLLAASTMLVASFVIGSFLMARLGRAFLGPSARRAATRYSDAWSNYRLTEEQIRSATEEPNEGGKPPG
jgi:hypothetical protein